MTDSLLGVLMFDGRCGALVTARGSAVETALIDAGPEGDLIAAVADTVAERKPRLRPGVVLGLASDRCLASIIERTGLLRSEREQAMRYRLEEMLPLDAEDLAAAFAPIDRGKSLGVAAETERVKTLIDRLAEAGIEIGPVSPTAMLAIERVELGLAAESAETAIIRLDQPCGGVDLIALRERLPVGWRHVATGDPDAVGHAVSSLARAAEIDNACEHDDKPEADHSSTDRAIHVSAEAFLQAAAQGAATAARRTQARPFDLRRGPLARRDRIDTLRPAWLAAGLAACLMLGSILGVGLWRTQANEAAIDAIHDTERAAFAELYPGRPAPLSIAARLRSELSALQSQRAPTTLQTDPPVLPTLASLLAAAPRDLRIQLDELRIDGQRIVLDGAARSHAQAAQLGRTLSAQSVVELEPPYTENLPGQGVGFTLTGEVRPNATPNRADRLAADGAPTPDPEDGS